MTATALRPALHLTLIGLVLTLGCGSLPFPVWDHELADVPHMIGNELIYWALVAATFGFVNIAERRPLASIGFRRPTLFDGAAALGAAIAMILLLGAVYAILFPLLGISEAGEIDPLMSAPGWWLAISVIRAGVSEEVLFRGYPIERLEALTGSRMLATLLPLALFALAHVGPWGWPHLIVAGLGGGALTLLYLCRRNLWTNILAHCLVDGAAVLLS